MNILLTDVLYRTTDDAESSDAVWSDIIAAVQASHIVVSALCQYQTRSMVARSTFCSCYSLRTGSMESELPCIHS